MSIELNGQTFYKTSEACQIAGISRATLFRWLREGIIEDTAHKDRRGWRLFSIDEINKIKEEVGRVTIAGNVMNRK